MSASAGTSTLDVMAGINSPHDLFFRESLSDQGVARDFLQNYLPVEVLEHVQLETLRVCKDTFVDVDLRESCSDLLYDVRYTDGAPGFVYFLFEHKSYPDKYVSLQLLRYVLDIWDLYRKQQGNEGSDKLPLVIPVVVYHGKQRGSFTKVKDLISLPNKELSVYVPDFESLFYDFSPQSDRDIKGVILLKLVLLCLRAKNEPQNAQHVLEIVTLLSDLDDSESSLRWVEVIFKYLAQVMDVDKKEMHEMARKALSPGKEERLMTLAEQWRQDGMQAGRMEGRHVLLERLLRKRFGSAVTDQVEKKLRTATEEQLDAWGERLLDAGSLDEVFDV